MAASAIIYDCEFLFCEGAYTRFWCGPYDPDPIVAQIGAVRLSLTAPFAISDPFTQLIRPIDRFGRSLELDPVFTRLTGITQVQMDHEGTDLASALDAFAVYAADDTLWSWGKDEFNLLAISCFVADIPVPLPASRFGNATHLALAAGLPLAEVHKTRSHTLMAAFGLTPDAGSAHDALADARQVALTLQHLLRNGRLPPAAVALPY